MIQPTSNSSGFFRTDALSQSNGQKTPAAPAQAANRDTLSSANTQSLREALAQTSEIRPQMVARGKSLAIDPTYPPRQIIESLAKLFVDSRDLSIPS
ncbi:MAG: hypothetical protein QM715_11630 [Nibricoccus sp.]